nr:hypothetical protein [Deltaproteobacteria bacterium]
MVAIEHHHPKTPTATALAPFIDRISMAARSAVPRTIAALTAGSTFWSFS